ncbi:MAG TPA: CinA family protein [Candidatus Limnocylindrales bacterium]|nr:CinA family protein [Candidatus Limnocylindrales bacterium]
MPPTRPPTDDELVAAARRLGRALVKRGWQMASAESCTGGLVGHVITQVPRSSDHFLGGIVSYSDAAKEGLLDVPAALIDDVGAVSAEVAEAMTDGALARFPVANLAVSVTGIAGPDGGSAEKPVGLTYVAAALRTGRAVVERHTWPHDRAGNKSASALAALELATRLAAED